MAQYVTETLAERIAKAKALEEAQQEQSPEEPEDAANRALDREMDAQFDIITKTEDVGLVAVKLLRPYAHHPFKPYSGEKLDSLARSIQNEGLHQPIIIRAVEGRRGYEILSGHNRVEAVRKLGRRDIPAIVRNLDDDSAALLVVNTNLEQRETLLPSEKAFAYKMQLEALQNSQNAVDANSRNPSDGNGLSGAAQIGLPSKSRESIATENGVDRHEVQRYIRLTYLLPELLEPLDQGQYPIMSGYEISFLDERAQQKVYTYFFQMDKPDKLSLKNAKAIRADFEGQVAITPASIEDALQNRTGTKKARPKKYSIPRKTVSLFALPDDFDFEAFVLGALEQSYQRR